MLSNQVFFYINIFTLVSLMEGLLKGAKGTGLWEEDSGLLNVADSVGRDFGDALLACRNNFEN